MNPRRTKERSKLEGDVGEREVYLAAEQRCCLASARGEEGQAGALLAGLRPKGRRGQAARRWRAHPLGSAHAGEGASDGAITPPFRPLDSLGLRLRCGEESGEERERAKKKMMIRVWERRPTGGFDIPK